MLKLKLQYFSHLMQRTASLEKTLRLGKMEGRRRRGRQRWHHKSVDLNLSKFQEVVEDREAWNTVVHWVTKDQTQLNN